MENDGFKLVSSKNKSRKRKCMKNAVTYDLECESDFHKSVKKLQDIKLRLFDDLRIHEFLSKLKTSDSKSDKFNSIICYGLGNISACNNAKCQVSFLLILKEYLQVEVLAYDPIFSLTDKKLLKFFHINLITENEEGKRSVDEKTLFFMPHCPNFLYNNLMWANWCKDNLKNVTIIGNSFKSLIQDHISSKFNIKYKCIAKTEKLIVEYKFPSIAFDAFNETSLIMFPFCNNEYLCEIFFNDISEPVYSDDEYL